MKAEETLCDSKASLSVRAVPAMIQGLGRPNPDHSRGQLAQSAEGGVRDVHGGRGRAQEPLGAQASPI